MKRKREFWQLFGPLAILYMYKKTNEKSKVVARGRRFDLEGRLEERMKRKKIEGEGSGLFMFCIPYIQIFFLAGYNFKANGEICGRVHIFSCQNA